MCNSSIKLVAWIDGELAVNEAADVARHVQGCGECQGRVAAYKEVSRLVVTYCDAAVAEPKPRRKVLRWVPALSGAVAAAVLLVLIFRPAFVTRIPVAPPVAKISPALVSETVQTPTTPTKEKIEKVHRRHAIARPTNSKPDWSFEPAVQIVIPAEAMFPPGAVPEGITFIASLSMSSDGSVQGLRLQQ
jgi:anti-sigma factor RsiW